MSDERVGELEKYIAGQEEWAKGKNLSDAYRIGFLSAMNLVRGKLVEAAEDLLSDVYGPCEVQGTDDCLEILVEGTSQLPNCLKGKLLKYFGGLRGGDKL